MSEQLLRAVQRVQSEIANHPKAFQKEQQTIRFLIDPVLNALGWHTGDRERVEYERKTLSGEADIVLKQGGYPVVIIEAKSLVESLRPGDLEQLTRYCNDSNVKTGLLTNGKEWRAYHFHRPEQSGSPVEQLMLFQVHFGVGEGEAESATSQLSLLTYDSIGEIDTKKRSILMNKYWQEKGKEELLEHLLRNYPQKFSRSFLEWSGLQVKPKEVREEFNNLIREKLNDNQQHATLQTTSTTTHTKRFESGLGSTPQIRPFEAKSNTDALVKVAGWLVENGEINPQNCPIMRGKRSKYLLIHTEKQHPDWSPFSQKKDLPKGLLIDTHGDPKEMKRLASMLLENFAPSLKLEDLIRFPN